MTTSPEPDFVPIKTARNGAVISYRPIPGDHVGSFRINGAAAFYCGLLDPIVRDGITVVATLTFNRQRYALTDKDFAACIALNHATPPSLADRVARFDAMAHAVKALKNSLGDAKAAAIEIASETGILPAGTKQAQLAEIEALARAEQEYLEALRADPEAVAELERRAEEAARAFLASN